MSFRETILNEQEKQWLGEGRVTRLTDNKEVQIYPMGAERYLSYALFDPKHSSYDIRKDVLGKTILVLPGFGNSGFLFALAGAEKVTIVDKDPVTIAWVKAFKKYYHFKESGYPSIGELMKALTCWYPPRMSLPSGNILNSLFWLFQPNALRRVYILYMIKLVRLALEFNGQQNFELDKPIEFKVGEIQNLNTQQTFDTAFVPYLLGVKNGIEVEEDVVIFMKHLLELVPQGQILVTPSRSLREFYMIGKRYFETLDHKSIKDIPDLRANFILEDKHWFNTQGLAIFARCKLQDTIN